MAKAVEPSPVHAALDSFVGAVDGETLRITKGELFETNHPAVKKWPELFGPVTFPHPTRRSEPVIEQATAAPGEKRGA